MAKFSFTKHEVQTTEADFHVLMIEHKTPNNPQAIVVIEPYTWAWVALQIGEGILAAAGGKIFSYLFGDGGLTKKDLKDNLAAFASVIAGLLRRELDSKDKQHIEASAASLQSLYNLYLTNKDTSYLTPLIFKADDLAHQANAIPLLTIPTFSIVGGIELSVLQEVYAVNQTAGNKRAIGVKANALVADAQPYQPALVNFNNGRFGEIGQWVDDAPEYPPPPRGWYYTLDGERTAPNTFNSRQDAENGQAQKIKEEFQRLEKEMLTPLYAIVDQWKQIAAANP